MQQDTGVGEDDDQEDVAKNTHQGDHRVYTTVEKRVNYVVASVIGHD